MRVTWKISNPLMNIQIISSWRGDICDEKLVSDTLSDFQPDAIVHFAAESHVDRSIDGPIAFVETNVIGTTTLLNASKSYLELRGQKSVNNTFRLLHVSTDEVFGSLGDNGFFKETTPYDPSSPYSASKASSDHFVRAWHRTYGFPALITNCSNNYGPFPISGKTYSPHDCKLCGRKTPPCIWRRFKRIRDWLFVKDHCEAIYSVLRKGTIGETYNIGGHNEIKNLDVVNTICSTLDELKPRSNGGSYSELITYVTDRPGHDFRYAIDASKINKDLGWSPAETFETGIRKTIQWYLDNEQWWRHIQDGTYNQERLGIEKSD